MLSEAKLPVSFWVEALKTTACVINRSPYKPLKGEMSEKIWSGNELSYDHLQVFGCKTFVHILKDERIKQEPKTMQCIFLGYEKDELGRLYDTVERKFVWSKDVAFVEDETIEDIGRKIKSDSSQTNKVSIKIVRPISPEDKNNRADVVEDNNEFVTAPEED
ncbi:hypothetical protein Nepgr_026584 [Nepenthes gracilis]|uniref:Retroviral polymerase SH3-like domain-containing protein n=1 Tax=Nepenthes gracilis TaxID=150966 RepID=A0AAD3TA05_NEPGR|nr:hypothetical protein Nepgr_026584 [Nepenthes gracilis]